MSKLINSSREFKGDYTIVTNAYIDEGVPHELLVTQEIHVKKRLDEAGEDLGIPGSESNDFLFHKSSVVLTIKDLHCIMGKIEKHRRLEND